MELVEHRVVGNDDCSGEIRVGAGDSARPVANGYGQSVLVQAGSALMILRNESTTFSNLVDIVIRGTGVHGSAPVTIAM
jgi:hypothetical protein